MLSEAYSVSLTAATDTDETGPCPQGAPRPAWAFEQTILVPGIRLSKKEALGRESPHKTSDSQGLGRGRLSSGGDIQTDSQEIRRSWPSNEESEQNVPGEGLGHRVGGSLCVWRTVKACAGSQLSLVWGCDRGSVLALRAWPGLASPWCWQPWGQDCSQPGAYRRRRTLSLLGHSGLRAGQDPTQGPRQSPGREVGVKGVGWGNHLRTQGQRRQIHMASSPDHSS